MTSPKKKKLLINNNLPPKKELLKRLREENFKRITLSFYRYVMIARPDELREKLFFQLGELNIFGRIYLAREGINAQMSVPENNFEKFKQLLYSDENFKNVPFKIAVEDDGKSFYKLIIKVRNKIVADGLSDDSFDVTDVGKHLSAEEWNELMKEKNSIVVDMRNFYESEVGKFENATCPDAHSFRQALPMAKEILRGKEEKKILLYCTGGIRCEKASAYLKHHGFKDVNQLYGGIIEYAKEVKAKKLPSKFIGKNFVFDERLGERITDEIISRCHQCGKLCDKHKNCANDACHLLFIQCDECAEKFEKCCSQKCQSVIHLPIDEQKKLLRKVSEKKSGENYPSRKRLRKSAHC